MSARKVHDATVGTLEQSVRMEVFDTLPEEILRQRYVGVLTLNGVKHTVHGSSSVDCQLQASDFVLQQLTAPQREEEKKEEVTEYANR